MDIIEEFFTYIRSYLFEYANLLSSTLNAQNKSYYLEKYIDTFIHAYYEEIYDTIDYKPFYEIKSDDLNKELKGKCFELIYELKKKGSNKNEKRLIESTYRCAVMAIMIDLQNYSKCELLSDYEMTIKRVFARYRITAEDELISKLAKKVKKNKTNCKEFLDSLNNTSSEFYLKLKRYDAPYNYTRVSIRGDIRRLKSYKEVVKKKMFDSKEVFAYKLELKLNMINAKILDEVVNRRKSDIFFVNLPINYIDDKVIEKIKIVLSNNLSKNYIVFILNYKDYNDNRRSIKGLEDYNFAAYVDMTHIENVQNKLDSFIRDKKFKHIILDNISDGDVRKIKNYKIDGKDILLNKYKIDSKVVK